MSMTLYLIWQMVGIFCAYFGVTMILPMAVFHRKLESKPFANKILLCYLLGNFYIVTIVQLLQILNISYRITLILAVLGPAAVLGVKYNGIPVKSAAETAIQNFKWLTEKHIGSKTVMYRFMAALRKLLVYAAKVVDKFILDNLSEIILHAILFFVLVWMFGQGIIQNYGYSASDIPVHNYWINAMGDNNIFVAGVYPHGYHCMIYFLHEVFGFDTYILLSLFAFVQVICVHFALLYFLKLCCKTKYMPYVGAFVYAAGSFFVTATYSRFASTLPQEFGMIFILPGIYYGFEFFEVRREEVKKGEKKKESYYSLCGFAMSFGMTLSAHFYNTVIAGIFCVAMAVGYLFLFVRKQYFWNVVGTCFISVLVAILPMVIAFATGTPLQGSLYWATEVIMGTSDENSSTGSADTSQDLVGTGTQTPETQTENSGAAESDGQADAEAQTGNLSSEGQTTNNDIVIPAPRPVEPKKSLGEKISDFGDKIVSKFKIMNSSIDQYVMTEDSEKNGKMIWSGVALLLILGLIYIIIRQPCYGAMLISAAVYIVMMTVILAAGRLGIPRIMDPARSCIYYAYSLPILLVFCLDGVLYLVSGCGYFKEVCRVISLWCMLISFGVIVIGDHTKEAFIAGHFETNEAVTCLTNIIRQEEDFMWTIVSANDELRMGEDHGYHYETITFLKQMEKKGDEAIITIPTPKVYIFVEKVPLDYAVKYELSGQRISETGADRSLPYGAGLSPYQGENRWVVMSRMYYWAQEYMRLYPNEMKVYMENNKFVCYVVEQNPYDLYNFAIDYGYNTKRY